MRGGAADTVERWLSPLLLSIFVLNAAVLWQLSYGGAPPFWAIPASLIMAVLAAFVVTHLTCKHMPLECLFEVESPVTTKTMWLMVLFIRRRGLAHDTTLPPLKAGLKKCVVQQRDVVDYRRVCQLESPMAHDVLPLLYLDALATSLKLFLAVHPAMPASLLGAIHLRSSVKSHRPVRAGEVVDITTQLSPTTRWHRHGREIDFVTEVRESCLDGQIIYQTTMTILCKSRNRPATPEDPSASSATDALGSRMDRGSTVAATTVGLATDAGVRFAALCGDYNPIHCSRLAARLFGQRTMIIHGMCVGSMMAEHALAYLTGSGEARSPAKQQQQQQQQQQPPPWEFEISFKRPVPLPGTVEIVVLAPVCHADCEPSLSSAAHETDRTAAVFVEARETASARAVGGEVRAPRAKMVARLRRCR